jgi:hypothetical protein
MVVSQNFVHEGLFRDSSDEESLAETVFDVSPGSILVPDPTVPADVTTETSSVSAATLQTSVPTNFGTTWVSNAANGLPVFGATTMVRPFAYGVPPVPAFNPVFNFGNVTTAHYAPTMGFRMNHPGQNVQTVPMTMLQEDDNDDAKIASIPKKVTPVSFFGIRVFR